MIPEILLAIEASRLTPRAEGYGRSPSSEWVWRCPDAFEDYFREFLSQRGGTGQVVLAPLPAGTGSAFVASDKSASLPVPNPMSAEIVANLQAAFRLSITELASVLRVKRPTVYAWMSESANPHSTNLQRLETLNRLASYWNRISDSPLEIGLKNPFDDGKSVLNLLARKEIPVSDITSRLKRLAQDHGQQSRTSVRSRLNRTKAFRTTRTGDPDLLT